MSDFKTHLTVASAVTGLTATALLAGGIAKPNQVMLYFFMGSVGGVLPDLDSDTSIPLKLLFNVFSPIFAFFIMFSQNEGYSLTELVIIWLTAFLLIKYAGYHLFTRFTAHRGLFHSIPMAALFWFLFTITLSYGFRFSRFDSWMAGFFVFFGFMIHLLLDEYESIEIKKKRLKKSFGTAFKLYNKEDWLTTGLLYFIIIALFFVTPAAPKQFIKMLTTKKAYNRIRFVPQNQWFKGFFEDLRNDNIKIGSQK